LGFGGAHVAAHGTETGGLNAANAELFVFAGMNEHRGSVVEFQVTAPSVLPPGDGQLWLMPDGWDLCDVVGECTNIRIRTPLVEAEIQQQAVAL
jgi:hypothetical protein